MNATTQGLRMVPGLATQRDIPAPGKRLWVRVVDAIIESRTRRAEQELRRHLGLVADILARTDCERPFAQPSTSAKSFYAAAEKRSAS